MNFVIGLAIALGCVLGGFAAMGGKVSVIWQPWEFVIIGGSGLGTFVVANSLGVIKDTGRALVEAILEKSPKQRDNLDLLALMFALMREMKSKGRSAVEAHVENPQDSEIFKLYPKLLANAMLVTFICDYMRLISIGNARTHEIEALMDEEIHTIGRDRLKPYQAITMVSDAMPALGIVAAVLGVIKAMGSLDQSPELLGGLIGAALVGTFAGIFISYGLLSPLANKIKVTREKTTRSFVLVKQTLLAFMNGAAPQIAVEFGRKTISLYERPSIDIVEGETSGGPPAAKAA